MSDPHNLTAPISVRAFAALHAFPAALFAALGAWFTLVDSPAFGQDRCSSCGVEGYVIAVYAAAAAGLLGSVAALARLRDKDLGRWTRRALTAAAGYLALIVLWHAAFTPYALVMLFAAPLAGVGAGAWWAASSVTLGRRRGQPVDRRQVTGALARAWLSALVLLPGAFAWTWADRVAWLVF